MTLSQKLSIKTGLDITIADITDKMFGSRIIVHGYKRQYPFEPTLVKRFASMAEVEKWVHECLEYQKKENINNGIPK